MIVIPSVGRITAEELLRMPDGDHYELVDGELVEKNVAIACTIVANQVAYALTHFNSVAKLGVVVSAEQAYRCFPDDPDKVRRPDVSFLRSSRLPREEIEEGYVSVSPDLAVEVVSPNDFAYDVLKKVREYLAAGVHQVWVIYPNERMVFVHEAKGVTQELDENACLEGGTTLPGFRSKVGDLFAPLVAIRGETR